MNLGGHIVARILADQDVKPFLDAGLDLSWLSRTDDYSSAAIFGEDGRDAYQYLLRYCEANGKTPSLVVFRKNFPEVSYRLQDEPETAVELLPLILEDIARVRVEQAGLDLSDAYEAKNYAKAAEVMEAAANKIRSGLTGMAGESSSLPFTDTADLDDSPAKYRIEGVMPWLGTVLLTASAKTGKSTLAWNTIHSIAMGDTFLGRKTDYDEGRIVYAAFEMEQGMIKEYAVSAGVEPGEVSVLPMKGRVSDFNILDPATRARIANQLAGTEILVLDPLGPLLAALHLDENSSKDVSQFREACESLLTEAGISLLFVVHHTGHGNNGRARGSSVLMDWPDVLWSYTGQDEDPRELKVTGRKVGGSFQIGLTAPGSGRICLAEEETTLDLLRKISPEECPSMRRLFQAMKAAGYKSNMEAFSAELASLEANRKIKCETGQRGAKRYTLIPEEY